MEAPPEALTEVPPAPEALAETPPAPEALAEVPPAPEALAEEGEVDAAVAAMLYETGVLGEVVGLAVLQNEEAVFF